MKFGFLTIINPSFALFVCLFCFYYQQPRIVFSTTTRKFISLVFIKCKNFGLLKFKKLRKNSSTENTGDLLPLLPEMIKKNNFSNFVHPFHTISHTEFSFSYEMQFFFVFCFQIQLQLLSHVLTAWLLKMYWVFVMQNKC